MIRNARFIHRFRLERLERRDLLCSSMASTAGMQAAAQIASFAQSHTVKAASESGSSAADESSETHLFATLTNSSNVVVGTAFYETEVHGTTTTQELLVNVAGGAANASYAVTVGTTSLGTLTTDANGNGRLYLTLNLVEHNCFGECRVEHERFFAGRIYPGRRRHRWISLDRYDGRRS